MDVQIKKLAPGEKPSPGMIRRPEVCIESCTRHMTWFPYQEHQDVPNEPGEVYVFVRQEDLQSYENPTLQKKLFRKSGIVSEIIAKALARRRPRKVTAKIIEKPLEFGEKPSTPIPEVSRSGKPKILKRRLFIRVERPVEVQLQNPITLEAETKLLVDDLIVNLVDFQGEKWLLTCGQFRGKQLGRSVGSWKQLEASNYRQSSLRIIGLENWPPKSE